MEQKAPNTNLTDEEWRIFNDFQELIYLEKTMKYLIFDIGHEKLDQLRGNRKLSQHHYDEVMDLLNDADKIALIGGVSAVVTDPVTGKKKVLYRQNWADDIHHETFGLVERYTNLADTNSGQDIDYRKARPLVIEWRAPEGRSKEIGQVTAAALRATDQVFKKKEVLGNNNSVN